jgi:hypothetical protein
VRLTKGYYQSHETSLWRTPVGTPPTGAWAAREGRSKMAVRVHSSLFSRLPPVVGGEVGKKWASFSDGRSLSMRTTLLG